MSANWDWTRIFNKERVLGQNRFHEALDNAIKKTAARCKSQKDPQNVRRLMRLAHIAAWETYLGATEEQYQDALAEAGACAAFELQFTSRIETETGCQSNFISEVKATVKLAVESGLEIDQPGFYAATAPLEYVQFTPPSGCSAEGVIECPAQSTSTTGSTFEVLYAQFFNLNISNNSGAATPDIMVEYDPGTPTEQMVVQCPGAEPAEAFQWMEDMGLGKVLLWHDAFTESHKDEGGGPFFARNWEYSGGSLYARKVYQGKRGETALGFPFIEDTTIEIYFTPYAGVS